MRRSRKTSGLSCSLRSTWLPRFNCARFGCRYYGSFDRLNVEDRGGFALPFGSGGVLVVLHDAFDEEGDGAFALGGFAYFGAWGEDA